jgi:hypothetical protein
MRSYSTRQRFGWRRRRRRRRQAAEKRAATLEAEVAALKAGKAAVPAPAPAAIAAQVAHGASPMARQLAERMQALLAHHGWVLCWKGDQPGSVRACALQPQNPVINKSLQALAFALLLAGFYKGLQRRLPGVL